MERREFDRPVRALLMLRWSALAAGLGINLKLHLDHDTLGTRSYTGRKR